MTVLEVPPRRKYSIRVTDPDGHERRVGKMTAEVDGTALRILTRTGAVAFEYQVVSSSRVRSQWELIADDGSIIKLAGCSCG